MQCLTLVHKRIAIDDSAEDYAELELYKVDWEVYSRRENIGFSNNCTLQRRQNRSSINNVPLTTLCGTINR
jgi:hypothetical protein